MDASTHTHTKFSYGNETVRAEIENQNTNSEKNILKFYQLTHNDKNHNDKNHDLKNIKNHLRKNLKYLHRVDTALRKHK